MKNETECFADRLRELISPREIVELAEHGAQTGWPGLIYYHETMALYDEFHKEIWEALYDRVLEDGQVFTNGLGCVQYSEAGDLRGVNVLAYLASYGSHDRGGSGAWNVAGKATFENMLVWWMAEQTAQHLALNFTHAEIEAGDE